MKVSKIFALLACLSMSFPLLLRADTSPQVPVRQQTAAIQDESSTPSLGFMSDDFDSDWNPFAEMERMQQQMHHILRNRAFNPSGFSPRMDVSEETGKYIVTFDLPGMNKDKIDIKISDQNLTVSGERKVEDEIQDREYHRIERSYGYFERTIPVPDDVIEDGVTAHYDNGVLVIEMMRQNGSKEAAAEKKIAVR